MRKTRLYTFLLLILFFSPTAILHAEDQYFFVLQKQEKKRERRWSLSDWIEQRDKMRLMDLWLALHSPTPYEFYLGGEYSLAKSSSDDFQGGWSGEIGGYAYIFGLELRHQIFPAGSSSEGLFLLRLLGFHAQGTNLTLEGGYSKQERNRISVWQPTLGVRLTLYLFRSFGIETRYQHRFLVTDGNSTLFANQARLGALLDFSFVRFFGGYEWDTEGGTLGITRNGPYGGLKLFF